MVLAVLGPTASGKSALGLALADRYGGEIINCDSTAVYRGFDIGTDKLPDAARRGIPHHLIDIAEPTEVYTAAQYARDAARVIREIHARGKVPILVGGTGFYYRALTRGLFPGPGADDALRLRLERFREPAGGRAPAPDAAAHRSGLGCPNHAARPQAPRARAGGLLLERQALTEHFGNTASLIADCEVMAVGLRLPAPLTAERVARRVDDQFARGIVDEVKGLLAQGVPGDARPFGGLVYRQVMDMLHGVRDEAATRALIAQENRRYARRQLIWFRKEPNLMWFEGPGERSDTLDGVKDALAARGLRPRGDAT